MKIILERSNKLESRKQTWIAIKWYLTSQLNKKKKYLIIKIL